MSVRLQWLWGVVPVPIVAADLLPPRVVGLCAGPLVLVRPSHADDWPTVVHELEHCRQFWRGGLVIHFLRYQLSRRYRLQAEVAAYAAELRACTAAERGSRLERAAQALATAYRLDVDTARCRALLGAASRRNP